MATSSLTALLLSLTTLLSGLTAQINNLQIAPRTQVAQVASSQKAVLSPNDFSYLGHYDVLTYGNNTTYMRSLTHRYVNGELRFLTLTHSGQLHEFKIAGTPYGGRITTTTGVWNIPGLSDHSGIWFNSATNQLWVTSSQDYTVTYKDAHITMMTLGTGGAITNVKKVNLSGIPEKRMYGGCQAVPVSMQSQIGGAYVCGWGGYTSLVAQAGGASIGPTMYAIQDPSSLSDGASISAKTLLDTYTSRGYRITIPINYFDGGDPRQNPATRPTSPPATSGNWLSPNSQGYGWMVWGDSYYNTGMWIETATKQGFVSVASLGKDSVWYCSSTLCFDGRQFELHIWDTNRLNSGMLTRPDSMTELNLNRGNTRVWSGNIPTGNVSGATYDPVTGNVYMIGYPLAGDDYMGRMFVYSVNGGGGTPIPTTPTQTPTDATVSAWSAWTDTTGWSTCSSGTQTKTQIRTRTVITSATNGGTTPALSETQTVSQNCTVAPTQPIQTNPLGHWKLDEASGSTAVDSSGTGNNGTLNNGPVWTAGKNGNGLSFDGSNDYVLIGNPASLTPSSNITMMGWARFDRNDVSQAIISKYGNDSNITQLRLQGTGEVRCSVGGTTLTTSGANVTANNWHHLACTYDGANIVVYVNGVVKGTLSKTGSIADSSGVSWRIGGLDINAMYMDGVIDDVKLYNRALTSSEIAIEISGATPAQTATDATVSAWSAWTDTSAWSTCSSGTQTKTQTRTRTVITSATNGGSTPTLSETQTISQSCTVTTPTDALVSAWSVWTDTSAWSTCSAGTQTKTQTRTRTVVAPATNGGTTPALSETQTISQNCTTETLPSTSVKFSFGTEVQTTSNLNVRETASISGGLMGTQSAGVRGKVVGGPSYSDALHWWKIDFADAPDGWSVEDYLVKYTAPVLPPPTSPEPVPAPEPTPTPEPTPDADTREETEVKVLLTKNLYYGMRDSQVKVLQSFLIRTGYLGAGNDIGFFGRLTYNAVRSFQRANNISATGFVGPLTRAVINDQL